MNNWFELCGSTYRQIFFPVNVVSLLNPQVLHLPIQPPAESADAEGECMHSFTSFSIRDLSIRGFCNMFEVLERIPYGYRGTLVTGFGGVKLHADLIVGEGWHP